MSVEKLIKYDTNSIDFSSIVYKYSISSKSKIIYFLILFGLTAMGSLLPVITIPISVRSNALISADVERAVISAPISGKISEIKIMDNQKVVNGETLIKIDAKQSKLDDRLANDQIDNLKQILRDLSEIIKSFQSSKRSSLTLMTGQYSAEWQEYNQELGAAMVSLQQAKDFYQRYEGLFKQDVISYEEFEKYKLDFRQKEYNTKIIDKKYLTKWNTDFNRYRAERILAEGRQNTIRENEKLYKIKSPINGSIQNLIGIQEGSYVTANQKIAEISPLSSLIAICLVKPGDIGLIKRGQKVKLQIDAYNYHQWGLIDAEVVDISDDIVSVQDNLPLFKVKCRLSSSFLILKNGYKGNLKKGMSARAHFEVAKRSLLQLLYDKVDDWVIPSY